MSTDTSSCALCHPQGERLAWRDDKLRVIVADEPDFPGFIRVVWYAHVAEMTMLESSDRHRLMSAVYAVESVLREMLSPDKINLASLGNYVPHLHWHVIPRYRDDPMWPDAVWAASRRAPARKALDEAALIERLGERLGEMA
jgi:diadenosine tetraphosphate (Ap4A) HIT family hydrolase